MSTMQINSPTAKQMAFLTNLAGERNFDIPENLDRKATSKLIDQLLKTPKTASPVQDIGVFILPDGTIVKSQMNRAKTASYTLRWVVIGGERLVDATEERVHGEWLYAPELRSQIKPEFKMTLEQAKAFILRYGRCARCGRKLKAAESVERGIGPVCKDYFSF